MLAINAERLWQSIMTMAEIGATEKGGSNRQALTDLDKQGRDLLINWASEIGCEYRYDQMGNLFIRYAGQLESAPSVLIGSHLDTQPTGGKFDGVYGVLAGLEVMRTLHESETTLQHSIELAVWTNEEGARFSPAMIGSGVWCGEFDLDYGWTRSDKNNMTIQQELSRLDMLGEASCEPFPVKAAFELHIEQGPILEQEQLQIGVVKGVQGIRWYDLILHGQPVHAGPTPMQQRQDPVAAMSAICQDLYQLADNYAPWARVTFGDIHIEPGARNTVPERLTLAVDLRHPENMVLAEMDQQFRQLVEKHSNKQSVNYDIHDEWHSPAVNFASDCITAISDSVNDYGYSHQEMFSGAGHDSVYVSKVAPTAMIFIPCEGGISHNEEENASYEDIAAGGNVLLGAVIRMAC